MSFELRATALAALLALCACGGSDTAAPKTPSLHIGIDTTLLVDEISERPVTDQDGRGVQPTSVHWESSNAAVALVSSAGVITAVMPGIATITASSSTASAHTVFTVAPQFLQIATGETHTCGLTGRNEVYCWGMSARGELGSATGLPVCESLGVPCSPTPVVAITKKLAAVVAGSMFTCGLDSGGSAFCWGSNFYGQLGNGTQVDNPIPQPVSGDHHFTQLVAGRWHACGIDDAQIAWCWGWDYTGQLGAGDVSTERCTFAGVDPCSTTPRLVAGTMRWSQLAATDRATCGITTAGLSYCWGLDIGGDDGLYCQEADDLDGCAHAPIRVGSDHVFKSITMGDIARCEQRDDDSSLECWGAQYWGAFGDGNVQGAAIPVTAAGGATYPFFSASRDGACALDGDHHALCWGHNINGQVGNGVINDAVTEPAVVSGGWTFASLATSGDSDHACGITTGAGRALCWGSGQFGQLGTTAMEDADVPQSVQLLPTGAATSH